MENKKFVMSIIKVDGSRVIHFSNTTNDFVEVIFTIDGKEVKGGKEYQPELKGYAYPPRMDRSVKKMKTGAGLPFHWLKHGEVKAFIFRGEGAFYEGDIEIPTFLRNRMAKSIKFKRTDKEPCEVLTVEY